MADMTGVNTNVHPTTHAAVERRQEKKLGTGLSAALDIGVADQLKAEAQEEQAALAKQEAQKLAKIGADKAITAFRGVGRFWKL